MPRLEGHVFSSDILITSEGVNLVESQETRKICKDTHVEGMLG